MTDLAFTLQVIKRYRTNYCLKLLIFHLSNFACQVISSTYRFVNYSITWSNLTYILLSCIQSFFLLNNLSLIKKQFVLVDETASWRNEQAPKRGVTFILPRMWRTVLFCIWWLKCSLLLSKLHLCESFHDTTWNYVVAINVVIPSMGCRELRLLVKGLMKLA